MALSTKDEPAFPPEMEQEIFRTTAILYPKAIPTLLRVAHRVYLWTEPLLYRTIRISPFETKGASDEALLRALDHKAPDFFSNTTRQLTLMTFTMYIGGRPKNQWTMSELERLLRACTGITELSICGCLSDPPILHLMEHLRPKCLNLAVLDLVSAFSVPNSNFAHPLFQRVSHLLLCDIEEVATPVWHHWTALSRLPALTHLAIIHGDLVPTILPTFPRLQVLVLFSEKLYNEAAHSWDQRVVVVVADFHSFWENWYEGVVWIRAEAFLDQKRRGEVPESCYQLPAC